MCMKKTFSFPITEENAKLLKGQKNMSAFLNEVLSMWKKYALWKKIQEGFGAQDEDDLVMAEEGFDDYLRIIEQSENETV